jgi:hypothetical protein
MHTKRIGKVRAHLLQLYKAFAGVSNGSTDSTLREIAGK